MEKVEKLNTDTKNNSSFTKKQGALIGDTIT